MSHSQFSSRTLILAAITLCGYLGNWSVAQEKQLAPQSQPDDVVRINTALVQTDVMVFDKQGGFVKGLRREDFELRIDGQPKPIEFFERVFAGSAAEEAQVSAARGISRPNQKNVDGAGPLDRGRTIFFYVDDFHLSSGDLVFLRKAVLHFIDKDIVQNDEAAIITASGQIGFLEQLTDNKVVLHAAVDRLRARQYFVRDTGRPPMTEYQALQIDSNPTTFYVPNSHDVLSYFVDEYLKDYQQSGREGYETAVLTVRNRARAILQDAAAITTRTLAPFENLVRSARQLPGRKLIFFISDGFFLDTRNSDAPERVQHITTAAAPSGVVVYSLDARGLTPGLPPAGDDVAIDLSGRLARGSVGELPASRAAMETLARDTGGRPIFDTNALDTGFSRALKETSTYYLLAWKPENEGQAVPKFRSVEIKVVGRPELTVRLRRGFSEARPASIAGNKQERGTEKPNSAAPGAKLAEAMGALFPIQEIPISIALSYINTPEKGLMLSTSMQIPEEFLSFSENSARENAVVDIAGSVFNDQGQSSARFSNRITISAPSADAAKRGHRYFVYSYPVFLGRGLYQVRVAARDTNNGRVGSAQAWIEIPDLSKHELALSSLMVGELRRATTTSAPESNAPGSGRVSLRVDHRFPRNPDIRFLVFVYNAAHSPSSQPDIALQVQVLRDEEPVITVPLGRLSTEGLQDMERLPYAADLSLKGLPAGRYILQVTAIDRISKTGASQRVQLAIE